MFARQVERRPPERFLVGSSSANDDNKSAVFLLEAESHRPNSKTGSRQAPALPALFGSVPVWSLNLASPAHTAVVSPPRKDFRERHQHDAAVIILACDYEIPTQSVYSRRRHLLVAEPLGPGPRLRGGDDCYRHCG